jgi:hypothetical protein
MSAHPDVGGGVVRDRHQATDHEHHGEDALFDIRIRKRRNRTRLPRPYRTNRWPGEFSCLR